MKTSNLSRMLCATLLAATLGACAHKIQKNEIPTTANPADEISRLEADVQQGYQDQLDVLAPKEFARVQSYLDEAREDMRDGEKQQEILDDVGYARAWLDKTRQEADGRRSKLQGVLDARKSALTAGSKNYSKERERLAELDNQLRDLADEDVSLKEFNDLQTSYLDLELSAIKATQLDKARAQIAGARRDGAEVNTPKTLRQAQLDLTNAENIVAAHRHNPEGYRAAVDKANQSAQLLTEVLAATKRPGEDLKEEVAIERVLQGRQLANLKGQLGEATAQSAQMSETLQQQNEQLKAANARQSLEQALEAARKEFSKDEAEVYQQGDKLLIRLKAMNFASGRADLPSDALPLLAKVKGVAEDLKSSSVVIEGHTDSTGSPAVNLPLSQKRAEAVEQYLETTGLEQDKVQAVGHGVQRPIASNKTKQGRAKNRRVDVIITPSGAQESGETTTRPETL